MSSNNTLSFELDESRQVHHARDHVRREPELILTKYYAVWAVLPDEENDSDEEGFVRILFSRDTLSAYSKLLETGTSTVGSTLIRQQEQKR